MLHHSLSNSAKNVFSFSLKAFLKNLPLCLIILFEIFRCQSRWRRCHQHSCVKLYINILNTLLFIYKLKVPRGALVGIYSCSFLMYPHIKRTKRKKKVQNFLWNFFLISQYFYSEVFFLWFMKSMTTSRD